MTLPKNAPFVLQDTMATLLGRRPETPVSIKANALAPVRGHHLPHRAHAPSYASLWKGLSSLFRTSRHVDPQDFQIVLIANV